MQPHEFVQLLEATQAANNNIRDEATQNIMKLRETNIDLFLNLSGAVISSNSFSDLSRSVALVLTYRTLILIQTTNSAKFLIQQYKEYLTSLLEICYNLFFTNIGVHAAPLLAEICDIYLDDDYNTTIIQELCLKIQPISDLKFIDNALIAFYQITQNEYLYDIQAKPLLEIVCSYLGVAEIPPESKVRCVYILSEMINDYMEAIIASQLTNVILQALGIVDLKAAAYKCVYALAKYFYVEAFQSISEKAINAALTDLGQINDDNLHDEIFEFIRAIAISEKLNQINNGIIQNCLQPILQASMMLTVKFFDSYDTDRYTSSSIQLLGILAKEFPQLTLNIYLQNADQQINNQNEQFRTLALYLYLFVVENCDIYDPNNPVESLILNIYEKTCSVLNTQSTQIYLRDTALKLLCEIAKKSDAFNMKVSECVPIIMSSIQISNSTAFSAFNTLININFYPHITEYVIYLLQLLTTPNPNFSYAVGQTIIHMIEHLKNYNELEALIANFHNFFMMSFQQPELNRNQEDIFSIYAEFCTKGQNLMLPYLSSDLEMFIQHFNIHHDPMILDVLTIIAISYSSICAFDKYLNQLLEMILLFLNDPMNNININYAFRSLTDLMKRRFPISHSFPILFKLILNIMNTRKNDFNIYLSFIKITTYIIGFYSDQNVEILCRQMMENVILDSINNLENYPFVDGIKLARKILLFILKAFEKVSVFQIQMDWIQVNPWIDMTCTLINKISQFDFSLIDDNVDDDDDNLDKDISIIYETLVSVLYQINQIIKIFDDTIQHMNVFKAFLVREDIRNLLKNLHKNFQKNQNLVTVLREIGFSNDEINIMLN